LAESGLTPTTAIDPELTVEVTWNRIVFAWGKLPKLARLFQ